MQTVFWLGLIGLLVLVIFIAPTISSWMARIPDVEPIDPYAELARMRTEKKPKRIEPRLFEDKGDATEI